LRDSGIIRSHRYLGDIAEFLCADKFGVNLATNLRQLGHDGLLKTKRVQIKYHGGKSTTVDLGDPENYDEVFVVLWPDSIFRPKDKPKKFLIYRLSASQARNFESKATSYYCTANRLNGYYVDSIDFEIQEAEPCGWPNHPQLLPSGTRSSPTSVEKMKRFPSKALVKDRVTKALQKLASRDPYLVEQKLHERSVTHKLAEYLQHYFRSWDVDCEYNKDGPDTKILSIPNQEMELEDHPVYPDIIIHKRGDWRDSEIRPHLLVIEARKSGWHQKKIQRDEAKVNAYISQLKYRYGALIEYFIQNNSIQFSIEWKPAEPSDSANVTMQRG
jgi:hypothetical protein